MQTSQKTVMIQDQEWILNECQKVQGLWITEKGCQRSRNEAALYCGLFKTLQQIESLTGLSRFVESNKLRKIFQCGDCPKYGSPCDNFEDVLQYIIEVQQATVQTMVTLDLGEHEADDVAEIPEGSQTVPPEEADAPDEEDEGAVTEEDLL